MEFWKEVRRQVLTNELSKRAACTKYNLGWHTLKKILAHAEPPGYRQSKARPGPFNALLLGADYVRRCSGTGALDGPRLGAGRHCAACSGPVQHLHHRCAAK